MKIFKSRIFMFILGALIFTGVGVYASEALRAQDVLYSNHGVTNVKDALDKLYENNSNSNFCIKITGNNVTPGSEYMCDPGDGIYRTFYVLSVDGDDVRLIMDRNITDYDTTKTITRAQAMTYFTTGAGSTYSTSWTNVKSIGLPSATEIATLTGNASWNPADDDGFSFNTSGNYAWLIDYTISCYTYGNCHIWASLDQGTYGYWTTDVALRNGGSLTFYWGVRYEGQLSCPKDRNDWFGVRPVITVAKTNLK